MNIENNKNIYFISDVHLGAPDYKSSLEREKRLVSFLQQVENNTSELFILGDLFDMWFDYKRVVPRGYIRILGQLAKMSDSGIKIHYFIGNHDMWAFDYFEKEIGVKIYREPKIFTFNNKKFLLGHGDGLGPGDLGYKFIKRVFAGKLNQWLFARLHPNFALGLASLLSSKSRIANGNFEETMEQFESEDLYKYCKQCLTENHIDYFIFGHRHIALDYDLGNNSRYINLGEWVKKPHYAYFDGKKLFLKKVEKQL
jgi:UDP-2,3-diacylglucosamine hydrolase